MKFLRGGLMAGLSVASLAVSSPQGIAATPFVGQSGWYPAAADRAQLRHGSVQRNECAGLDSSQASLTSVFRDGTSAP